MRPCDTGILIDVQRMQALDVTTGTAKIQTDPDPFLGLPLYAVVVQEGDGMESTCSSAKHTEHTEHMEHTEHTTTLVFALEELPRYVDFYEADADRFVARMSLLASATGPDSGKGWVAWLECAAE